MIEFSLAVVFFLIMAVVAANISYLLGPKSDNPQKQTPFECGSPLLEEFHENYFPRFFGVALIFLIFDIEAVFFFPLALVLKLQPYFYLPIFIIFFVITVIIFFYISKKGGFLWE